MSAPTIVDILLLRSIVLVAPALTIIVPPFLSRFIETAMLEVINDDLAQTLNVQIEKSAVNDIPWSVSTYDGFLGIAPGENRLNTLNVSGTEWLRVRATASGAGLFARVSLTVQRRF